MPAKVLVRHVPEWFQDRESFVEAEIRRRVANSDLTPEWVRDIEPLSMRDLLRAGFERPLQCGLFLELPCKSLSREALREAVPWLELFKDPETLLTNLRYRGWLLFRCPNNEKAQELQFRVKTTYLRCIVLGSLYQDNDLKQP